MIHRDREDLHHMRALRDPSIDISHAPDPTSEYSSADLHQFNDQYPLNPQLAWPRGGDELIKGVMASLSALSELLSSETTRPVSESSDPNTMRTELGLSLSAEPQSLEEVIEHLTQVMRAAPLTSGPRFFNQLFGGRDPAAFCGELFAALGNHSVYTYKVAGPLVLIEDVLIQTLGRYAGLSAPDQPCGGIFTPGGSLSNLAAMLCARDRCAPEWRERGMIDARVYTSAEAHYSVRKGAGIIGLGRDNVIAVECDEAGRLSPQALQARITADREAGHRPMLVVATAGTTVRGAFDPIDALADVCEREDLWLHVDGAFGGSALLTPTLRGLLRGIERADSLTWDAHKAMGVPLTCSVLLTRDSKACARSLSESASYLFQADDDWLNPGTRSLQCGRRNDALKLWAAWRYHGDLGWARRVERARALALDLAEQVESREHFKLCESPHFLNVCFEYVDSHGTPRDHQKICRLLQVERRALVGYATFKGRVVVRAAVINPELTSADLTTLLDEIETVAPRA